MKGPEKKSQGGAADKRAYTEKLEKNGKDCPSGAAGTVGATPSAPRAELMPLRRGTTPL